MKKLLLLGMLTGLAWAQPADFQTGMAALSQKKYADAVAAFSRCLDSYPQAYLERGTAHERAASDIGMNGAVVSGFDPALGEQRKREAVEEMVLGMKDYAHYLKLQPDDYRGYHRRGRALVTTVETISGSHEAPSLLAEALKNFEQAIQRSPRSPEIYADRAEA
jgi:tetratricopeptide (TPR) repeat protein